MSTEPGSATTNEAPERISAVGVLRRGIAATPELRPGLRWSIALAVLTAFWRLVVPIAVQQVLDRGIRGGHLDLSFVAKASLIAIVAVVVLTVAIQWLRIRLTVVAEDVLWALRTRAFGHVHRLSIAAHSESKTGTLVARVTSDIETLSQFAAWGAMSWVVNIGTILVTLVVLFVYSPMLAAVIVAVLLPVLPIMRTVQRRQLAAYDDVRDSVSATMSTLSEAASGLGVIRSYGATERFRQRIQAAIDGQLQSQLKARFYFAMMFPVTDLFGGFVLGAVAGVALWWGPSHGLQIGVASAVLLLASQLMQPIAEIGEVLDQTQTAISGWNKVLGLLDEPIELIEPEPGVPLASTGALSVELRDLSFAYGDGRPVLDSINLSIPAGAKVAIVGETGSGKSTMAKLLVRLADPRTGVVEIGEVPLAEASPPSRRDRIRLVPQDGFLFDISVAENAALGMPGATRDDVAAAFDRLGLSDWVAGLPDGLDTNVGDRGGALSVGERQFVALARAELGDPGLLILDEATSSIDPESEQRLSAALHRLAEGRTMVSVAHRLATAEAADWVVVVDRGRIAQMGTHDELVEQGGIYGHLHNSWIGNTRAGQAPDHLGQV